MITRRASVLLVSAVCLASPAFAASWPEIPRSDWDLQAAPGAPKAPGVVLLDRGRLVIDDQGRSSFLEVYTRIKVLNEEGRSLAKVSVGDSRFNRLQELEGRTNLPDGRIVELPADAKFEKEYDTYFRFTVHTLALPTAEVGAIIEYRYKLYFDTIVYTDPWYFQTRLPTLVSEFNVEYPHTVGFSPVEFSPYGYKIERSTARAPRNHSASFVMRDLPAVPDEPWRMPFHDLSAWVMVLPVEIVRSGRSYPLFRTWEDSLQRMEDSWYAEARQGDATARARAKALLAGAISPREKAEVLYRFVRDEIADEQRPVIVPRASMTVDKVLVEASGSAVEKALLLQTMLDAAKVDARLGLVRHRSRGRVQEAVPTPHQFEHALVVVELDGRQVFLDAADPDLPFGALPHELEGVRCLLTGGKTPEWVTTLASPADWSSRVATLALELAPDGRLAGSGSLTLAGHWSWTARQASKDDEHASDRWRKWLEERLPGFDLEAIEVTQTKETLETVVTWKLAQRADVVAGDEVSFRPSAPLGLASDTFAGGMRQSPVQFDFPDLAQVELRLRWPEGWRLEARPKLQQVANSTGSLETSLAETAERELVAKRKFVVAQRQVAGTKPFAELRDLYSKVAANDAEELVLVKL